MSISHFLRLHICCTMQHTQPGVADRFIKDVADEVAILMKDPTGPTTGVVSSKSLIISFSYELNPTVNNVLLILNDSC